jgi:hypothetical protein
MGVKDRNVLPAAAIAKRVTEAFVNPPISQASIVVFSYTPGYRFQLSRVRSFCRTKAGAVSFVVKVGGRSAVAAGTLTAATEVAQTLSTTLANLQGSTTEAITIEMTTDGSGAVVDGRIILEFRPRPMDGEAAAGDT